MRGLTSLPDSMSICFISQFYQSNIMAPHSIFPKNIYHVSRQKIFLPTESLHEAKCYQHQMPFLFDPLFSNHAVQQPLWFCWCLHLWNYNEMLFRSDIILIFISSDWPDRKYLASLSSHVSEKSHYWEIIIHYS